MITFMYRWEVSQDLQDEFRHDWTELTLHVQDRYGLASATLYSIGTTLISITCWPSKEAWQKWKVELANHPSRMKWRSCRVSGPEELQTLSCIGPVTERADSS